jgi:hypothetical protein
MAGPLIPIMILGLGIRMVASEVAKKLMGKGLAEAAPQAVRRAGKEVYETMESLPKWVQNAFKTDKVKPKVSPGKQKRIDQFNKDYPAEGKKRGGKVFKKGGKVFNGNDFVRSFYEGGSV